MQEWQFVVSDIDLCVYIISRGYNLALYYSFIVSNHKHAFQIYAGSFFAIPLVRWFFVQKTNAEIEKRNQAREQRALALEQPDLSLRRKVQINLWFPFNSQVRAGLTFEATTRK